MSKPCRRLSRAAIKEQRAHKKQQEQALRQQQRQDGLIPRVPAPLPNRCSAYATLAEEQQAREAAVSGQVRVLRRELPALLAALGQIPEPRNPKKCRHRLTVLLLYGLLMFVFQFASRRAVNRELTHPQFEANLRLLFPELETLPHADTLFRLLRDIDVTHLEQAHIDLVRRLIRAKTFRRYLINHAYPIAIDGSQKFTRDHLWDENLLERQVGAEDARHTQYFVYVLEASLAFHNGLVIPLLSEFLEYAKGDTKADKQDCERRAFTRLSARIKTLFPRLPILLLLDGLYADGPVMQCCHQYHWQFMIVFKDKDLPTVWEEFHALHAVQPAGCQRDWGERHQRFSWVNAIDYAFSNNTRRHLSLHVVVCEETWETIDEQGARLTKTARHAWLSSQPLSRANAHERCNLGARYRWGIEAGFLVEKHQGYHYEHAFALNWNAMKGYHYLMRLAHLFNTLARFARHLRELYRTLGVRGAIAFIRASCAGPWLDPARMRRLLAQPLQLQLE
ncbi:transposase family protein [Candidatus Thiodictyon syntrophicum]|nr:transposase family protein [Candidatus Thiodictyon syntrophicum]